MKIDEFRDYLKINKTALDDEIIQQPMLYFKISEAYVQAIAERDTLKERLATVDAELDGKIRKQFEDQKITEAMVKNQVQTNKQHKAAQDAYMAAKMEADTIAALKEAFAQRSYMIRDMVQLHVTGYFDAAAIQQDAKTDQMVYERRRRRLAEARGND